MADDLATTLQEARSSSPRTGRPGPVRGRHSQGRGAGRTRVRTRWPETIDIRSYDPLNEGHSRPDPQGCAGAAGAPSSYIYSPRRRALLGQCQRPSCASWSAITGHPVTNTLMGLGAFPGHATSSSSACSACTARYEANMAMQNCDVLIAIGARFDDRVIGNPAHFSAERAQDHPYRYRPGLDLASTCKRRHSHRRQRARTSCRN